QVGQRVVLDAEFALGIGHARDPAVDAVQDRGDEDGDAGSLVASPGGGDDREEAREQAPAGEQVGQQVDPAGARRPWHQAWCRVFAHAASLWFCGLLRLRRRRCGAGIGANAHRTVAMRRLRTAIALALPCALLLAAAPLAAQQVYKWKDANGVTQYTSTPPPEG